MDSKKIYRRLTENIQNKIAKYKEGKSTTDHLNSQLIINISSLCRFLQKREEEKKIEEQKRIIRKQKLEKLKLLKEKLHKALIEQERKDKIKFKTIRGKGKFKYSEDYLKLRCEKIDLECKIKTLIEEDKEDFGQALLDIFVPFSRLTKSLQVKLESLNNEIIEEENENEKDISLDEGAINLDNSLERDKLAQLIVDEDEEEAIDNGIDLLMPNGGTEYLNDDNLSISMSLFNKPLVYDDDPFKMEFGNKNRQSITSGKNILEEGRNSTLESEKEGIIGKKNNDITIENNKDEELKKANELFKNILKPKIIKENIYEMSYEYLTYMYNIFVKMKANSDIKENSRTKSLNFINHFKSFVLDIGISDKKFYEQCIREIIYNKNELDFAEFLECFKKIINLKFDQTFLKYKFLFHITERENEEYFKKEELKNYFNLLHKCKKIYEQEIHDDIKNKLVYKYKKIFSGCNKLYTRKLAFVLELFFDLK